MYVSNHYDNASAKVMTLNQLTFKQIEAGYDQTCGITTNNKAYCWGRNATNSAGQTGYGGIQERTLPTPVAKGAIPTNEYIKQISSGNNHTCAVASDDKGYCWGFGLNGRLGHGSVNTSIVPAAMLQGEMPGGVTVKHVAAGDGNSCLIGSDDKVYCWGGASNGVLGNGVSTGFVDAPVAVSQGEMPGGATVKQLTMNDNHACVIASDDKAYCWGYNYNGQLGNGNTTDQSTPVAVSQGAMPGGSTVKQIAAFGSHTCAIASDDKAYCWGYNFPGNLGNGSSTASSTPVAVSQGAMPSGWTVKRITGGDNFTCATANDNKLYCWGYNFYSQLGNGLTSNSNTPAAVSQGAMPSGWTIPDQDGMITGGFFHTCAIASNYKAYCWARNNYGQLGNGTTATQSTPGQVLLKDTSVKDISSNNTQSCAIASDNKAYCWGAGANGRLGNGGTSDQTTPVAVSQGAIPAGATIRSLSVGSSSTCVIASDNKAYCWGLGTSGRLGDGNTADQSTPVAVSQGAMPAGSTIRKLTIGDSHACAVASDNKAYCWGSGTNGRLGNADTTQQNTPVAVSQGAMPAGSIVNDVTVGPFHSCAIAADNLAYCWGLGTNGQLGNAAATDQTTPVAVSQGAMPAGATIRQIALGNGFTCAVASDNNAYCWGAGAFGQLGNNTTTVTQSTPVAISQGAMPLGVKINKISAGSFHGCLFTSYLYVYCWGYNANGQLGDGTIVDKLTPVSTEIIRRIQVSQSVFRSFAPSATSTPGSPLAATNTDGTLGAIASEFRVRVGITNQETEQPSYSSISAGDAFVCGITIENQNFCWGRGPNGRLGYGSTAAQPAPIYLAQGAMPAGSSIRQVAAATTHTCAVASDNKAYCWGAGANYRRGDNSTLDQSSPVAVSQGAIPAGVTINQVAVGGGFSCAVGSDHKAYCWGANLFGQVGDGTGTDRATPVAVSQGLMPAGVTFRYITGGGNTTCAIGSDNLAYCWGNNSDGQLGLGNTTNFSTPRPVTQGAMPSGATILQITVGTNHVCAVASDHKAYCWGQGTNGQLGDGTTTAAQQTPVAVSLGAMPTGATIRQISAGGNKTCAVASDNKAYCWGQGLYGQLGNGASSNQSTPVAVAQGGTPVGSTIVQITAGGNHTCAIASDNKAYCWGFNDNYQLGNGANFTNQSSPVAVIQGSIQPVSADVNSGALSLTLETAPQGGAASCSAVASGWQAVSTTTPINWGASPPVHGTAIAAFGSDPTAPTAGGFSHQSIVQSGIFTNTKPIPADKTGLWDFVLHDRSLTNATNYCFRLVSNTAGTSIDTLSQYPRVTTATGSLALQFTDDAGTPLSGGATGTSFTSITSSPSVQQSTGELLLSSGKLLEAHNSVTNSGWSISLAATGGPSSTWQSGGNSYAYNASTSASGQLTVDLSGLTLSAHGTDPTGAACATTNLTNGTTGTFTNAVSSITLLSGSASSQFNCTWRLRSINLSQTIPANQAAGTYTIDMTATVVAG